jgi:hypothetical protein
MTELHFKRVAHEARLDSEAAYLPLKNSSRTRRLYGLHLLLKDHR